MQPEIVAVELDVDVYSGGHLVPGQNEHNVCVRALQNKTGAHAPCGMSARFPHSLLVTEGLKMAIPMSGRCGFAIAAGSAIKMPDCLFGLVKTMSRNCKNYARGCNCLTVEWLTEVLSISGLSV